MWLFKKMGELTGVVEVVDVPPFLGHSMSLSLFRVHGLDSPPPFPGIAPLETRQDEVDIGKAIHFDREDVTGSLKVGFQFHRPAGWYYVQLNVILYRKQDGNICAQVERFPFRKRPLDIPVGGQTITLPVSWPDIPLADLEHYGRMIPGRLNCQ